MTDGAVRKMVVGIDGSEAADRALAWALAEAATGRTEVDVVTAWQRPLTVDMTGVAASYLSDEEMVAAANAVVRRATDDHAELIRAVEAAGGRVTTTVTMGPADDVLETESKSADLVVVGRRGHRRLARFLGSVSRHVADHAACPVVVVPEP